MGHSVLKGFIFVLSTLHNIRSFFIFHFFIGLAACPENKKFINQRCGVELLAQKIFGSRSTFLDRDMISYYAASSMRNLSDSAKNLNNPHLLSTLLLDALRIKSEQVSKIDK